MKVKIHAPVNHPRYLSLLYRDILSAGVKKGITSLQGLTAHGRGEAFDYLVGEKTMDFSATAIEAAAAILTTAKYPVVSVNGNTAALAPGEMVRLAKTTRAKLEVNLFHASKLRERKITAYLKSYGADKVLLPDKSILPGIKSNRRMISREGQKQADVVFIPLEDGDRTESLIAMGKKVITVDLNPLSRTAQKATVTIIDNIIRCLPLLTAKITEYQVAKESDLRDIIDRYNNRQILALAIQHINRRLDLLAKNLNG